MRNVFVAGLALATLGACGGASDAHAGDVHADHAHVHGDGCGHQKVRHGDHWDYLHDGHLHFAHDGHFDEHVIEASAENPVGEAPLDPALHADHAHSATDADHSKIRHEDHMDYIHDGRLHFVHGDHVDDHGPVAVQENG